MEEKDLIRALKSGESTAFTALINQFSHRVVNTCYRFLLNQQDAEDIAQEVFIEVYQSIHSFRVESKLSTWIYRIAVTKSLDEIKKRNRKKRFVSIGKMLHLDDIAQWIGGGAMPDANLQEQEEMQIIMSALNTLPDSQRVAFTLSKIDGYSNAEIAEIMNTTVIAVESLIHRAKKQIGVQLRIKN